MKKFLTILLLLATMFPFAVKADELTVKDGTNTSSYVPVYGYFADCYLRCQMVYPATDLAAMNGGNITSIKFYAGSASVSWGNANFQVYMMEVPGTTISSFINPTTASTVYTGSLSVVGNQMVVTFATPYHYTGGNLLIGVDNLVKGSYVSCSFYGQTTTGASVQGYSSSNVNSINPTQRNFLPKATFEYMISTGLAVTPVDFGYRPNNAWMEPVTMTAGGGMYNVTAMDLDNDYFTLDVQAPFTTPKEFTATTGTATAGPVEGTLTMMYNDAKSVKQFNLTANAYNPQSADVWETATVIYTPMSYTNTPAFSTLYRNYNLPEDEEETENVDAVYKVTYPTDVCVSGDVTANGKLVPYQEGFKGQGGPMADNYYNGMEIGPSPKNIWFGYDYSGSNTFYGSSTSGMIFGYEITAEKIAELGLAGLTLTEVEAAARESYPYDLIIMTGEDGPENVVYYQPMGQAATALYFFNLPLDTPYVLGEENTWILFMTDSPYSAYCGKNPVDPNGKIWYTSDLDTWYTSTNYTPVISCHFLELPTGREVSMNLADMSVKANFAEGTMDESVAEVNGTTTIEKINAIKENRSRDYNGMFFQAGTYYLVAAAENPFTFNMTAVVAPAPQQAIVLYPYDGQVNVESPYLAQWVLGNYTTEMQVKIGSQYPPQDVLIDWTSNLVEAAFLTNLLPNTSYFIQVNERNASGTTMGEINGFTTKLEAPVAEVADPNLYPGDAAQLSWEGNRSFRGYNVYADGVRVNEELIVEDEYAVEGLTYGQHVLNVTAVYDEGESGYSNNVVVDMTGFGQVAGAVYEIDATTPIEEATVTFVGTDAFGVAQTFAITTAADGTFEGDVLEGMYASFASKDGYQDFQGSNVIIHYDELKDGLVYYLREAFNAVGQVVAEEVDNNAVNVYWDWTPATVIEDFEHDGAMPEGWTQAADYGFEITTTSPYEGMYCIKSTNAGLNSTTAAIEVTVEVPYEAKMSFMIKPSSESNYDKGYFYLDGVEKCNVSGAGSWEKKEYILAAGTHTYKWAYTKDSSVGSNDDCLYVDYVTLYEKKMPDPPFAGGWIQYDNGTYASSVGTGSAGTNVYWAVMFPANSAYTGCTMTKASLFDAYAASYTVNVYEGGEAAPGTLIGNTTITGTGSNDMVESTFSTPITIDATKTLWIVGVCNELAYPMAGCNDTGDPNGRWVSLDGSSWEDITSYGLSYTWMLRGYLESAKGEMTVLDAAERAPQNIIRPEMTFDYGTPSTGTFKAKVAETPIYVGGATTSAERGNRTIQGYKLYRQNIVTTDDPVLVTTTTDTSYVDNAWATITPGVYQWGVSVVYDGNRGGRNTQELTVYDGTNSNAVFPFYTYYCDQMSKSQWIMPAADLAQMAGTTITSLSYYMQSPATGLTGVDYKLYMMETSATTMSDFVDLSQATLVYEGPIDNRADFTVTLDTPFEYNGGNLLFYSANNTIGNYKSAYYYGMTGYTNACLYNTGYSTYTESFLPKTTFTYESSAPVPPTGVAESEIVWSNTIEKDMETTVDFSAVTNNGASAAGTVVTFTNQFENVQYTATLDATGFVSFPEFRCGNYTLEVVKDGYTPSVGGDIAIFEPTTINCTLTEIIAPAEDLYASATGWVMWTAIGGDEPTPPTPPTPGEGQWYGYDNDNANEDAIGTGGGQFSWGIMLPAGTYEGNTVTKVAAYDYMAMTGTATVYMGATAPTTAVGQTNVTMTGSAQYVEYELATPAVIDPSQNVWIIFYNASGATYPAAVCANTGDANGRWVSLDGVTWEDLASYGLSYTFQVRAYIAPGAKSEVTEIEVDNVCTGGTLAKVGEPNNRAALYSIVMLDGTIQGYAEHNYFQLNEETLVEGQEYTVSVASVYATGMSDWMTTTFTYYSCENFRPGVTNFAATADNSDVNLTWTLPGGGGGGGTGDVFFEDFENGLPAGWTTIDADGDGYTWRRGTDYMTAPVGHNSNDCMFSNSYDNSYGVLYPDNYLVSPQVNIGSGSEFSFYACAQDASYAAEHFGVAVSTTGTSASDFTTIAEWTMTAKDGAKGTRGTNAQGTWYQKTVDLSSYAGQQVYIAIRHFNCSDMFYIDIDDAQLAVANKGNRDMWDFVTSFSGTSAGQQGVATDGEFIYTASWQSTPTGGYTFYKYDLQGNFVEGFNITGATGIRDLTYDGEYFYGSSGASQLFILDLANKTKIGQINCSGATTRHCTYDPARDAFWTGNWSDLALYDRNGSMIQSGPSPSSAYGSGYFQDEDGTEHLYLFCQPNSDAKIYDYNITTGSLGSSPVLDFASTPGFNAGIAGGSFIGEYDGKICWFGNAQQDPNLVGIYELAEASAPVVEGDYLGAMIFRDGELITPTPVKTTSMVDTDVEAGEHEYMARLAYGNVEFGILDTTWYAMSCPVYATVEVEEPDCTPVSNLQGDYEISSTGEITVELTWNCTDESVLNFKVYRNGLYIGTTTDMVYTDDRTNNPGSYTYGVVAVYANCESDMVTVDVIITSIEDNAIIESIYPNPTNGNLHINATSMKQVTIANTLGQVILVKEVSGNETVIDMSVFEAGVYMVTVATENGTSVKRISVIK